MLEAREILPRELALSERGRALEEGDVDHADVSPLSMMPEGVEKLFDREELADLFAFLEQAGKVVRDTHPKAQLWVSTQSFNLEKSAEFLGLLKDRMS